MPENILSLQTLVRSLLDKISVLEARILELESLKLSDAVLEGENIRLKAENAGLKSRLGLNSHNSSKPPSSDGLSKKPAFPRGKGGNQGGQRGHSGKTLEMVKNPDQIIECRVLKCPCGSDMSTAATILLARRQEFDLPEPRLEVTEFRQLSSQCPDCGQIHKGAFPDGINAPTQYGHRVKAFTTLFSSDCKLSFEKTAMAFSDMYGYSINEGTIQRFNKIGYDKLEPVEDAIEEKIIESLVVNADETGIRCAGKLWWLHVASTCLYTYLFVHKNRGKEAIESEDSILNRFFGWAVHDCWSSYFMLTHLKHALCGAHLLRELQAQIEGGSKWATEFKKFLIQIHGTSIEERLKFREKIEADYGCIIAAGQLEEPQPEKTGEKGRLKRTKGRNLLERLQKHKDEALAFAFNEHIPFTNNQAERDIRPVKVKMKVSGCFRTDTGAKHYARIAGFISTVRKHKRNVFAELCAIFKGQSFLVETQAK